MLSNKVLVFFKKAPSVKQTPYYPLFGSRLSASQIRELAKLKKHKSPFRRPLLPSLPQTNIPSLYNTSRRLYSTNISSTHSTEITYTPEDYYQIGLRNYLDGQWEDAMGNLSHAVAGEPRNDKYAFALGAVYYCTSKSEEAQELALKYFKKAFKLNPISVEAAYHMGLAQIELKQYSAAMNSFTKVLELNPKHADAHNSIGWVHYTSSATEGQSTSALSPTHKLTARQAAKLDSAISSFRTALKHEPKHAKALTNLGNALLDRSETPEALQEALPFLREAVELAPQLSEVHYNLATALKRSGEVHASVAHFRTAIAIGPATGDMWNNLGLALLDAGDPIGARESFSKAIELIPSRAEYHTNLAISHLKSDNKLGAIAAYEEALTRSPSNDDLLVQVAILYREVGQKEESLARLKRALEINPQNPETYKQFGVLSGYAHQWAEASAYFRKSLDLKKNDPETLTYLGATTKEEGKTDEAESLFKRALRIDPDANEPLQNLASLYFEMQRLQEAQELFEKLVARNPENPEVHMHLGFLLQHQHRLQDALPKFKKAVELGPNDWAYHYNYALALGEAGQEELCIQHMTQAQKLNPTMFERLSNLGEEPPK